MQDCLDYSDWDVFCNPHGKGNTSTTDCITEYTEFYGHTTLPAKTVHCIPKLCITSALKALLNKKNEAFQSVDKEEIRRIQHNLKAELRRTKDFRRKLKVHWDARSNWVQYKRQAASQQSGQSK